MHEAPAELRSFDELAKICLKAADWPASARMQARSLGAILGRLDRGEGTDWLAGRNEVQRALAGVLGVPRGTLSLALSPKRGPKGERWINWQVMPFARGLDLAEEALFPGIPEIIFHPGRWERLVWVAPSGAGRALAGQWLAARGLAAHRTAVSMKDAPREPRPLLLELASGAELRGSDLGLGLCVAVPDPWEPPVGFGDCMVVRSPPAAELVEPLVAWARERLAARSEVEPARLVPRILEWVERGVVESAGDVLGLIGLADAEGMDALETHPLERAARSWMRRRARERLDPEAPESAWLQKHGFESLVGLARRVALDGRDAWFTPRSAEDWSDLVPDELRHGPDLEWMKTALPRADPSLRPAALERASEKLPPGAFRIVRSFEHAAVLARDESGLLAPRPHWLARAAMDEALASLVDGPAYDWGEALLSPSMAPATMERLVERARARALPSEELVEPQSSADPSYAAGIEGAVRALGAAELALVHAGGDALEALFDEQLRLCATFPDELPGPRIEHAPPGGRPGAFWLTRGAWYLALLALGESLEAHQGARNALLRPWVEIAAPKRFHLVLEHVALALDRADAPRDVLGPAVALVSRLGASLGPLGAERTRHRLERAATVADEAAVGVLAWQSVTALEGDRLALAGLFQLAADRRLDPAALATQVWQAFEAAGMPEAEVGVLLAPELAGALLPHAPPRALRALARGIAALPAAPPLEPGQWSALFDAGPSALPLGLFRHAPQLALDAALDAACRAERRDALEILWSRFPAPLTAAAVEALADPESGSRRGFLLRTVPATATQTVLGELPDIDDLLRGPAENLQAVRRFLHTQIAARGPGFRDAYALFDEIERHLEDLRAQS
jgi:hypothetical protein